jgi:hypothetical protein
LGAQVVLAVSGDLSPEVRARWSVHLWRLSWLEWCAGRACGLIGVCTGWPWMSQVGSALRRMSRASEDCTAPCPVVWVHPAFGGMSANRFGACDRAIALGREAMRQVAPLLQEQLQISERSVRTGLNVSKPG